MTSTVNQMALLAATNECRREELIQSQEQTILRTASSVCRRYISRSDDEWSIALSAFSKAVDVYNEDRGDFLPFAQMLIKRDLIDYYRSQKNTAQEVSVAPHIFDGTSEPEEDTERVYLAVVRESVDAAERSLHDEIVAANAMLQEYGFRFFDLTECSPQQEKTRRECAVAIRCLLKDPPLLVSLLRQRKKLPSTELYKLSGVSRKTLDRYRKYIIMAVLILNGEYPKLSEYLKFVRKEGAV